MCGLLSLCLFFEKNNCLYTHTKTKDKNIEGKEDRNEKTKEKRIEVYVTVERTVTRRYSYHSGLITVVRYTGD